MRDILLPGAVLEACIVLLCYALAAGVLPGIPGNVLGGVLGVAAGAGVLSSVDRGRLRVFANTIVGFRVDGFVACRSVLLLFIGALCLLPTWMVWHSWDCILAFLVAALTCLLLVFAVYGELPVAGAGFVLAVALAALVLNRAWALVAALAVLGVLVGICLTGVDHLRYGFSARRRSFLAGHARRKHRRFVRGGSVRAGRWAWSLPVASLPHPLLSLSILTVYLAASVALAVGLPGRFAWKGYVSGFLAALVFCDQIGVNLMGFQRRQFAWLTREGMNILPLAHRQLAVYLALSVLVPAGIFLASLIGRHPVSQADVAARLLGQMGLYASMSLTALILSSRCSFHPAGLYAIPTGTVLVFEVLAALTAVLVATKVTGWMPSLLLSALASATLALVIRTLNQQYGRLEQAGI